ncbi:MAG: glycosyltransferase family 9 protein [Armatimonadetes bacterium]|nr:glycosyltransferase family 9 protein [Armatimonadota bacterium]
MGVVWAGARGTTNDHERTIPFARFAPLLDCPGVTFYSLQCGERAVDLQARPDVIDLSPQLGDFADTAAFVSQLDLVISVDTSVAHLAGALARDLWLLLPYAPDFRWMLDREDTPWYPTARLIRQTRRGDWGEVIARARQRLEERARR